MDAVEAMRAVSGVCRAAKGRPNQEHRGCTGCGCACHDVAAPPDFRAIVEQTRAEHE